NQDHSVKLTGDTVVVGGGNVAVDVARSALRAGDGKVTMLCLESPAEMPAAKDEVAEAKEEGIEVRNGWGPKEVLVEDGKVKGIVFKKCTAVFDAEKRFNPQYDENETITIECKNILLSIGQSVEWGELLKDTKVEIRRNGTAVADPVTYQTAEPDIFVGGDVFSGAKFVIDAIAAGREGFVSINRYVHPGNSLTISRDRREFIELDKDDILVEGFDNSPRAVPGKKNGDGEQVSHLFVKDLMFIQRGPVQRRSRIVQGGGKGFAVCRAEGKEEQKNEQQENEEQENGTPGTVTSFHIRGTAVTVPLFRIRGTAVTVPLFRNRSSP
ncbi:MAG: FAD-dependent oxidoreductase, partial [Firmicutes bacterium]|nr:FAD-dependent oxidoreductase [Bacillota bacterium]